MQFTSVITVIALLSAIIVDAGKVKTIRIRHDENLSSGDVYAAASGISEIHGSSSGGKVGYSAGSGLRSIAQGSADQAHSAAANQHAAGQQASYVAKSTLAQAALQAAATAQAALAGKHVLLQGLEHQSAIAHQTVEGEIAQLQLAKRSAAAAQQAAHAAQNHVSILTSALNSAQGVAEHAGQAAHETAGALASQTALLGKAKSNLSSIENHLNAARIDFAATEEAAQKAASAANEAQNNAAAAGAHATYEIHESLNHQGGGGLSQGSVHQGYYTTDDVGGELHHH